MKHKNLEKGMEEYELKIQSFDKTDNPDSNGLHRMYRVDRIKGINRLTILQEREDGLYYYFKTKEFRK